MCELNSKIDITGRITPKNGFTLLGAYAKGGVVFIEGQLPANATNGTSYFSVTEEYAPLYDVSAIAHRSGKPYGSLHLGVTGISKYFISTSLAYSLTVSFCYPV